MHGANGTSMGNGLGAAPTFKALVGPLDKNAGGEFNCTSSICYGIGAANHQTMLNLQSALNRLASAAGYKPVGVDGKIGGDSVEAAHKAAKLAINVPLFTPGQYVVIKRAVDGYTDKVELAQNAPLWYYIFSKTADFRAATPTTVPGVTTTTSHAAATAAQSAGALPASMATTTTTPGGVDTLIAKCKADPNAPECAQIRDTCANIDIKTQSPDLQKLCTSVGGGKKGGSKAAWWIAGGVVLVALTAIGYVIIRKQRGQALAGAPVYRRRQLSIPQEDENTVES